MTTVYRNYSLHECDATLARYKDAIFAGHITFWQKFTCEKCFARITVDEPNKLFSLGHCQQCNHISDLQKFGCNYALQISTRRVRP